MTQCKEGYQKEGLMLDSSEEFYKWFTQQVSEQSSSVWTQLYEYCIMNVAEKKVCEEGRVHCYDEP